MTDPAPTRVTRAEADRGGIVGLYRIRCAWCDAKINYWHKPGAALRNAERASFSCCGREQVVMFGRKPMTDAEVLELADRTDEIERQKAQDVVRQMRAKGDAG